MTRRTQSALTPLLLAGSMAAVLCGCAQGISTPLPSLARTDTQNLMTPAQQSKAIADLNRKKAEDEALAIRQIERTH